MHAAGPDENTYTATQRYVATSMRPPITPNKPISSGFSYHSVNVNACLIHVHGHSSVAYTEILKQSTYSPFQIKEPQTLC